MKDTTKRTETNNRLAIGILIIIFGSVVGIWFFQRSNNSGKPSLPIEMARTNLVLVDERLRLKAGAEPFNGVMLEHYPDGSLMSRTCVSNGLLNGISLGYYTNGQVQVEEYFINGVSHGKRTKWYMDGVKESEAGIVEGNFQGSFVKWYPNGVMSEMAYFEKGHPQGESKAFFPSGFLKARMVMKDGNPTEQQFWKDGEMASQ